MPELNISEQQNENAVVRAKIGSKKYLSIMDAFYNVDVSTNAEFQKVYNGFYGITPFRDQNWQSAYFRTLEDSKNNLLSFRSVVEHLLQETGQFEASFSSKLVATRNPFMPVWDRYVLQNTGLAAPKANSDDRIGDVDRVYLELRAWYEEFLGSTTGKNVVRIFNSTIDEYYKFTDIKKVDIVLWQLRGDETINAAA